jgi:hypothetical protein
MDDGRDVDAKVAEVLEQVRRREKTADTFEDRMSKAIQQVFAKVERQRRRDSEHVEIREFSCDACGPRAPASEPTPAGPRRDYVRGGMCVRISTQRQHCPGG